MANYGHQLLDAGFTPLPIAPRDKFPARWNGRSWGRLQWARYRNKPPSAAEVGYWSRWPDCGIGIICGDVVAVDIDLDDEALCATAYDIFNRMLGVTPAVRIGRAPRKLLVYRTEAPFKKISGGPIEILADGQQFVAYGIHPAGHEYRWLGERLHELTMDDLPLVTEAQVRAAVDAVLAALPETVTKGARIAVEPKDRSEHQTSPNGLRGTREGVAAALEALPNNDLDWKGWCDIGLAVYAALGEDGFDLFDKWSRKSSKYNSKSETTLTRWDAMMKSPPIKIGAASIYYLAEQTGWRLDSSIDKYPQPDNSHANISALLADGGAASDMSFTEVYSSAREEVTRAMMDDGAKWVEHVCLWNEPKPEILSQSDGRHNLFPFDVRRHLPIARGWRVSAGAGKTEIAIQAALKAVAALRSMGSERSIVIATPTHTLAEQLQERVERIAEKEDLPVTVRIYRGRGAQVPGAPAGLTMCQNLQHANEASEHELNVRKSVCKSCPYRGSCASRGYLSQDNLDADIWIINHQYLFLKAPPPIARRGVGGVIVDENCTLTVGLLWVDQPRVIPLKDLAPGSMRSLAKESGEFLDYARKKLADACRATGGGPLTLEAITAAGFTHSEASDAASLEWERIAADGPELAHNKTIRPMVAAFQAIEELMQTNGQIGGGWVSFEEHREKGPSLIIKGRKNLNGDWQAPTILLDAHFNEEHHKLYWQYLDVPIDFWSDAPNQKIIFVTQIRTSKSKLVAQLDDQEMEKMARDRRFSLFARLLSLVRSGFGKWLVATYKSVEELLTSEQQNLLHPMMDFAHFNALRGLDQFRDHQGVIVVGRPLPPPESVENIAEALFGRPVERLDGFYPKVLATIAVRTNHSLVENRPFKVYQHTDEAVDFVLKQICRVELEQAIARGRGIQRNIGNPLCVLVLSDYPPQMIFDEVVTIDDILPLTATNEMLALAGIAVESGKIAHKLFPDHWPSAEAAEKAINRSKTRLGRSSILSSDHSIGARTLDAFEAQLPGQGKRPFRGCWDSAIRGTDPRPWLEQRLGPLGRFKVT
jgi:hypothetical protein